MPAQKACKGTDGRPGCGNSIILVHVPAGGVVPLEPFPVPPGHETAACVPVAMVKAGGGRLAATVIARADADPDTKWYERHRCVTASKAVPAPHRRPQQLGLDIDTRPPDPGRL